MAVVQEEDIIHGKWTTVKVIMDGSSQEFMDVYGWNELPL